MTVKLRIALARFRVGAEFVPIKQQFVDFRLRPWADQYLMLRADLSTDEADENAANTGSDNTSEGSKNRFTPVSRDEAICNPNGT